MKKILSLAVLLMTCLALSLLTGCGEKVSTVTFDSAGGSTVSQKSIALNSSYTLIEPTKAGYDFGGWYFGESKVESSGTWTIDEEEVSLTAKWNAKTYTITLLNLDGVAGVSNTISVKSDEIPTLPTNLQKAGHVFTGWTYEGAEYTPAKYNYAKDIQIVAVFTPNSYKITLDLNGGSVSGNSYVYVKYGQAPELPDPTKDGYTFDGWFLEGEYFDPSLIWEYTSNKTIKAEYIAKKFSITIDKDNGEDDIVYTGKEYNSLVLDFLPTTAPTKTGYDFVGWALANGDEITNDTKLTSNLTIKAVYAPKVFDLNLDVNGGNALPSDKATVKVTYGRAPIFDVVPERLGYTFNGWKLNGEDFDASLVWNYTENQTIVADWLANEYTISLNVGEGGSIAISKIKVVYGQTYEIGVPLRTGYTFQNKWLYNGQEFDITTAWNRLESIELVAVWTANNYKITLYTDGGAITGETEYDVTFGALAPALPTPTKEGYNFLYWYVDGGAFDPQAKWSFDDNKTLTAKYEIKKYNVTVNGTTIENVDHFTNVSTLLPETNPVKAGYLFDKWVYEDNSDVNGNDIISKDTVIKAKYTAKTYTLNFDLNGAQGSYDPVQITYGQPLTITAPTRTGFTFVGWTVNRVAVTLDSFNIDAENNATLTMFAEWQGNPAVVKFYHDINGADAEPTQVLSENIYQGLAIRDIIVPTKTGYTFLGWKLVGDNTAVKFPAGEPVICPEQSVVELRAVWEITKFKVSIKLDAGEVLKYNGEVVASRNDGDLYYEVAEIEYLKPFDLTEELAKYTIEKTADKDIYKSYKLVYIGTETEFVAQGDNWTANESAVLVALWTIDDGDHSGLH